MPYCTDCGSDIPEGSTHCPECGVDLEVTPPQEEHRVSSAPYTYGIAGILFGAIFSCYGAIFGLAEDPFGIFIPVIGFVLGVYGINLAYSDRTFDDKYNVKSAVCAIAIISSAIFIAVYAIL